MYRLLAVLLCTIMLACQVSPGRQQTGHAQNARHADTAYFAAGCFWCVEAIFESIIGVTEAVSGYAGGHSSHPSYEQVGTGTTGHAETVQVIYDSAVIDFPTLVMLFFACHDPTQVNGQGPDIGTQYRSIAFYRNGHEEKIIRSQVDKLNTSGRYTGPLATQVLPLQQFWPAEDYHQNFVARNPQHRYVQQESLPRLHRFRQQHPDWLKKH